MLNDISAKRCQNQNQEWKRDGRNHFAAEFLKQPRQSGTVDADIVRIGNDTAHGRRQVPAHGAGKCHQYKSGAGDHEPGIDLLAFDDVAALESLLETLLCRFFCFVGVAEILSHARGRSAVRCEFGEDAFEVTDKGTHHRADHQQQ